jgi:hypothetical protein
MAADTAKGFTSIRKYENDYQLNKDPTMRPRAIAATR